MNFRNHGGGCCGVKHLHGFDAKPKTLTYVPYTSRRTKMLTLMKRLIRENGHVRGARGKMFEVILTDPQIREMPEWIAELKAMDFRLVTRFHNSTGGWCNVFHMTTGRCRDDNVPDWWSEKREDATKDKTEDQPVVGGK